MFFIQFGFWAGGGVSQGIGRQRAYAAFDVGQLKKFFFLF